MSRLPVLSAEELIKVLEKQGFYSVRQRGSHIILQKRTALTTITAVVPNHKELAPGTLRTILKRTGISLEELIQLLTLLFAITPRFW